MVEALGGRFSSSLSKETDLLVAGDAPATGWGVRAAGSGRVRAAAGKVADVSPTRGPQGT